MLKAATKAEESCNNFETVRIETVAVDELSDGDISPGGQSGKKIKSLEDEPDLTAAQLGALGVAHGSQIVAIHKDAAFRGFGQAANYIEERRFSAARGSHNRHRLAWCHCEVHATKGGDVHFACAVKLQQIFSFEYRLQAFLSWDIQPFGRCLYCSRESHLCLAMAAGVGV
jgi:hypothetical protein